MRRSQRLIAAAVLISLSVALAGCSDSLSNWDPSDMLDWLDTKKKVPGDRKPVFPDGVPGLEQGVPKELYKGSAQERIDQQNAQAAAAAEPAKSKQAKSKNKQPAAPADAASAEDGGANAAPPAPKPKKIARQPAQSAQPAPPQQSAAPFPAPMPSGTFAR
jgi:hypothetical protein